MADKEKKGKQMSTDDFLGITKRGGPPNFDEAQTVQATGRLLNLIERAGNLQNDLSVARRRYENCRSDLKKELTEKYGNDVAVYGTNYWVINSHDKHDRADIVDVLKKFTDNKTRRKVLRVMITELRELIGKDEKLMEELVEIGVSDAEPTLHVNKIDRGGDQ